MQLLRSTVLCLCALCPAATWAERAELSVSISDGDPFDRIFIQNSGECTLVQGALELDFTTSQGRVLIDTEYGGPGTKDPMPVAVEHGPLQVRNVVDGDRQIVIEINGLLPFQSGIVTLDVDNEATGWFAGRVSILGQHLSGTTARFTAQGQDASGIFGDTGEVVITLPAVACSRENEDLPELTVPIS